MRACPLRPLFVITLFTHATFEVGHLRLHYASDNRSAESEERCDGLGPHRYITPVRAARAHRLPGAEGLDVIEPTTAALGQLRAGAWSFASVRSVSTPS
jgi:hypothetical protein